MTYKIILLPIIAVLFAVGIQQVYAEDVTVQLPFDNPHGSWCNGNTIGYALDNGTIIYDGVQFVCAWQWKLGEGFDSDEKFDLMQPFEFDNPIIIPEMPETEIIESEPEICEAPKIMKDGVCQESEQTKKVEGITTARAIVEAYGLGELDVEEYCFGGDKKESQIFEEHETIDIKRPLDNQPLKTNLQLYYEHLMSEICKAEYKLQYKVGNALRTLPGEGDQYVFTPPTDFSLYEGFENAVGNYTARDQVEYYAQHSLDMAEGFQCSILGKQQGHCIKEISDQPIPKPTISKAGDAMLNQWRAYQETGLTELPEQDEDEDPKEAQISTLKSMMKAYNITATDLED